MTTLFRATFLVWLILGVESQANAYHLFTVASGGASDVVRWQTFGNVFTADTDGPAGQNFTTLCTTATTTWNAVVDAKDVFGTPTTSAVNFTGANLNTAWGLLTGDGKYELVYDADGSALTALGLDPAVTNGYGPDRERLVGGVGTIDDAFFVVTGTRTNFDLLSTLTHELGHIQGLAHSTVGMSTSATPDTALDKVNLNSVPTMHPFSLPTGNTSRRTLEPDDAAGLRELYPEAGAAGRWASVAGEVRRCGTNAAVIGANIRLVSTADPNVQISRFSSYDGNANGRYVINYVPAGSYRIVVEPMGVNGFTLNRFGSPPPKTETDFDFEYLSPPATELACTEETPETSADIATVTGTNGVTVINNDFRVGAPDIAFVVDDTGSMGEEISGVRNVLNNTITALQAATPARPFPLTAIITFKDDVTKRIVSNKPAQLTAVVNSLFASGGGDCPEAGDAALVVAGRILRRNGVAMFFSDADSRPDGPARSTVTALYRSKGIRLNVLLSGTCSGTISPSAPLDSAAPAVIDSSRSGASNNDEYPPEPVLGSEPGVTTYSSISNSTGGFFVAIPGIKTGSGPETTRYIDTGTNIALSSVLPALALVTPTNAPRSATENIQVDGANTNFIATKSALSFAGSGITVNSVNVISPTRLIANITLSGTAALGFRDATITTDLGGGVIETATGIGVVNVTTLPAFATVLSATPAQAAQGQTADIVISTSGVTLTSSSTVNLGSGITVLSTTLINPNTIQARVQVSNAAAIGYRFISVSTPGASTATDSSATGAFQVVVSAPIVATIDSLTPNQLARGTTASLTITGLNTAFAAGTSVNISGTGVTVNSVSITSPTVIVANVTVDPAASLGFRDVIATTGGQSATILNGLQITVGSAAAGLQSVTPNRLARGTTTDLTVTGVNTAFGAGTSLSISGTGVTVNRVSVTSPTVLVANVTVDVAASLGFRDVVATTGSQVQTLSSGVEITAGAIAPTLQPQTITFAAIPDHLTTDAPFALQATASSALPVQFSVAAGPATIAGNTLTLTGTPGKVIIEASQSGSNTYAATSTLQTFNVTLGAPKIDSVVNSASYAAGPLTANLYATIFGNNFSAASASGDANATDSLLGTSVAIVDSAKQSYAARLWFVSFGQINFVVPGGIAAGPANVTVTNAAGKSSSFAVTIAGVAPALFSADRTGSGGAAAVAVIVAADGSQTALNTSSCAPLVCTITAIPLASGTQVYLTLFGTGIRGASGIGGVSLTIGGVAATVKYAGAQGTYPALDQVNALVPQSLAGAGLVDVKLTVDGVAANTVKVRF